MYVAYINNMLRCVEGYRPVKLTPNSNLSEIVNTTRDLDDLKRIDTLLESGSERSKFFKSNSFLHESLLTDELLKLKKSNKSEHLKNNILNNLGSLADDSFNLSRLSSIMPETEKDDDTIQEDFEDSVGGSEALSAMMLADNDEEEDWNEEEDFEEDSDELQFDDDESEDWDEDDEPEFEEDDESEFEEDDEFEDEDEFEEDDEPEFEDDESEFEEEFEDEEESEFEDEDEPDFEEYQEDFEDDEPSFEEEDEFEFEDEEEPEFEDDEDSEFEDDEDSEFEDEDMDEDELSFDDDQDEFEEEDEEDSEMSFEDYDEEEEDDNPFSELDNEFEDFEDDFEETTGEEFTSNEMGIPSTVVAKEPSFDDKLANSIKDLGGFILSATSKVKTKKNAEQPKDTDK